MRFQRALLSPGRSAVAFGLLASLLTVAASWLEGTLVAERTIQIGATALKQHPYISNISTILDFAVFDPIAIYFCLSASEGYEQAFRRFARPGAGISRKSGLAIISLVVGVSAMWFYYQGFVGSTVFTDAFEPDASGSAIVSATGWVIFVWTSLFLALLVFSALEFGAYALFVRSLGPEDIRFSLPLGLSRDVTVAIRPCLHATYVLVSLFAMIGIFVVRDFWQLGLHESRRVWLLGPYLVVLFVAFLPFWHLHSIMAEQKSQIVEANQRLLEEEMSGGSAGSRGAEGRYALALNSAHLMESIDRIDKLQKFYRSVPVWPSSSGTLILPNISVLVSGVTLAMKIADTLRHA
jgi:hypothetical protein